MICPALFNQRYVFYAFGNTPAVSLTQDLPPEQDADILLLGCGDARNVLFTCFADVARKIDVTCCDIEPLVHARNVLLYSLLMEDTTNLNIERIWKIYYDWKLDKESLALLETQAQKLVAVSESIDQWHGSIYGSTVRFCDVKSLSCVRSHWMGFRSQGSSQCEKTRLNGMQAAYSRAKAWRDRLHKKDTITFYGLHPAYPMGFDAIADLCQISDYWWEHGTLPSSQVSASKPTDLNPAVLYSTNPALTLSCTIHPLLGIPLCTAFTPLSKDSTLYLEHKDVSSTEYLVDCAKSIFKQWALAFRRAVANKSVIRIFCGDAFAFSFTLRSIQLAQPAHQRSTNLPCNNWTTSPVQLHAGEYGNSENSAPLNFNVVDTSNLLDVLGPLNVISVASSLLKHSTSSCLYTETLINRDANLIDRLNGLLGVDVRTVSLLLGLVAPELFTSATNSFEDDPLMSAIIEDSSGQAFARSRLRWRRLRLCQKSGDSQYVRVEAGELAKFLIQVHSVMFRHEDLDTMNELQESLTSPTAFYSKMSITQYNRASFASLVSFIKATVISEWNQCVEEVYKTILCNHSPKSISAAYSEDLILNMHLYGVDNGCFQKSVSADKKDAVLAKILPTGEDLQDQLCVTIRVPRKDLSIFTRMTSYEMGSPTVCCSFNGRDPGDSWYHSFSSVQVTFGTWHEQIKGNVSYPHIEEDSAQQSGTSDMFISVMVPTDMLLQAKRSIPLVLCQLVPTFQTMSIFNRILDEHLCFAQNEMTSKNVFVTKYIPGMCTLPAFSVANSGPNNLASSAITVQLEGDGSKIKSLIQRVILESAAAKAELAIRSTTVSVTFNSPFTAVLSIGQSEKLKLKFPVPVSPTKYRIKIARKSSYINIETHPFDPLAEDSASFLFPTCVTEVRGVTVPTLWTSTRIDLDVMPPMDLTNNYAVSWIVAHTALMFSNTELSFRLFKSSNPSFLGDKVDTRSDLKDGLFSIFLHYADLKCQQAEIFALTKADSAIQTLIFPSCLRLDLVNRTVVLDVAIIPLTTSVRSDRRAAQFVQKLTDYDFCQIKVSEAENRAWKAIMPALVERCRTAATWKHTPSCEYVQSGEVPLPRALIEDGVSPICSCGMGKLPKDYLRSLAKRLPDLNYMLNKYATRAAIAPVFAVPYVEDCSLKDLSDHYKAMKSWTVDELSEMIKDYGIRRGTYNEKKCVIKKKCVKCNRSQREGEGVEAGELQLLYCSRCRLVSYCSKECQKVDWKKHKVLCYATQKILLHETAPRCFYVSFH